MKIKSILKPQQTVNWIINSNGHSKLINFSTINTEGVKSEGTDPEVKKTMLSRTEAQAHCEKLVK